MKIWTRFFWRDRHGRCRNLRLSQSGNVDEPSGQEIMQGIGMNRRRDWTRQHRVCGQEECHQGDIQSSGQRAARLQGAETEKNDQNNQHRASGIPQILENNTRRKHPGAGMHEHRTPVEIAENAFQIDIDKEQKAGEEREIRSEPPSLSIRLPFPEAVKPEKREQNRQAENRKQPLVLKINQRHKPSERSDCCGADQWPRY